MNPEGYGNADMDRTKEQIRNLVSNPNLASIYSEVRHNGPISKSKLGTGLRVSKPTRYALINSLLEGGLLISMPGPRAAAITKRSALLDIRSDIFCTIGVDLHLESVDFLLMDLKCGQRDFLSLPNQVDDSNNRSLDNRETILGRIRTGIKQIMDKNRLTAEDILAVGISDFGMVDAKNGISVSTPHIDGWVEVPLRSIVQRVLPVPVYLGRDANMVTIAEIRSQKLGVLEDVLCISLREGIGLGIYLNGDLYTGHSGNAGELSHTQVNGSNAPCVCGKEGCLDTLVGYSAVMERARAEQKANPSFCSGVDLSRPMLETLFESYGSANQELVSFFRPFIGGISAEIANLSYIFDPGVVILSGRLAACSDSLMSDFEKAVHSHFPDYLSRKVRLQRGSLGRIAAVWGAAYMAQEMLLNPNQHEIIRNQHQKGSERGWQQGSL